MRYGLGTTCPPFPTAQFATTGVDFKFSAVAPDCSFVVTSPTGLQTTYSVVNGGYATGAEIAIPGTPWTVAGTSIPTYVALGAVGLLLVWLVTR